MYCHNCGNKLPEGAVSCSVCGTPVGTTVVQEPVKSESDLGLISMILSIVSFVVPFIGLPLAIVALIISLNEKKNNGGVFTKYGKIGFICSLVSLGIIALLVIGYIVYRIAIMAIAYSLMLGFAGM